MDGKTIRLATRGSPLAMTQARMAADYLAAKTGAKFEIVEVKTRGDKDRGLSLSADGGTGLFTKEIEEALLRGDADVAVHSAKDLPTAIPNGLRVAACLPRDPCRDVLAARADVSVPSVIASSSPRRRMQLKRIFPNAVWRDLRGNVHTRLEKIAAGYADATVLSEAGLVRLGVESFENIVFTPVKPDVCVPAPGQGIIALECRAEDFEALNPLGDAAAFEALSLERAFLRGLGGGCQSACAANYDGCFLRIFHEEAGFQKLDMSGLKSPGERLAFVGEIVSGLGPRG